MVSTLAFEVRNIGSTPITAVDSCISLVQIQYGQLRKELIMYNENMLDTLTVVSFLIGLANYRENLTQSDKDDIMNSLDQKTHDILEKVQESLEEQNAMLREILKRLR